MSTPTFPSQPPDREAAFAAGLAAFREGTVRATDVRALSDLTRGQTSRLRADWPSLDLGTRRDIVRRMGALGREHVELLFGRALRVALDDDDATVRQLSIAGLWEDAGEDLRERLLRLAETDPSQDVRAEAVRGLGRFAERGVEGHLPTDVTGELHATLAALAADEHQPSDVRQRALESIGVFGDAAAMALIRAAFDSDEPELQTSAVAAMGRSMDIVWLDDVLEALESDDAELRREAAVACGALGDPRVVAELARAALDPAKDIRVAALNSLGAIGGKTATRILETAAADEGYPDRTAAEAALASILDDHVLP